MQIHVDRGGQRLGPFSLEEVNRQLAAGTLNRSDNAWYEGAAGWMPLSSVPGVGATPEAAAPSAAVTSAGAASTAAAPAAAVPAQRADPLAVTSFVLGIVGLLGFCCGGGLLSIGAIICGHISLSNLPKTPERTGRGLAIAGLVLGYITFGSWVIYLIFFGGMAAIGAFSESLKNH